MRLHESVLELSATDLAGHLACKHLSVLGRRVARGELTRPVRNDPALDLLIQRGREHERAFVEHLRSSGRNVVDLDGVQGDDALRRTLDAARAGADVIMQAALADGRWSGRADVLERVARPSALGDWSYDVLDTKLAQETRGGTVLQLCLYADLLGTVQGQAAENMSVVKPGEGFPREVFRFDEYKAYYRLVKQELLEFLDASGDEPYPEPVPHCDVCAWFARCDGRRHADDHLSLVAGMRSLHAGELRRQGVATLAAFARARPLLREAPRRGQRETYERLQGQADVQLRGREQQRPLHELLPVEAGRGLACLPAPDPGDVFLDFEGDPFVPGGGLEYLLGYACLDAEGAPRYAALWALDHAAEKRLLEVFVDFVQRRLRRHPGLHLYHYAPYEPAALKRLASRHATRELELDELLRGERFVDLYAVTRQGLRASVESYSLKPLEVHFGYTRRVKLREQAAPALRRVSCALELGTPQAITPADRDTVQGYNEDDCCSLVALRAWLEQRRAELVAGGAALERPARRDGSASEAQEQRSAELQRIFEALVTGVSTDPAARSAEESARWLLAHLLEYFQREERVAWWEFFARRAADEEALRDDRKALVGLRFEDSVPQESRRKRRTIQRYSFPPQEVSIDVGDEVRDPRAPFGAGADRLGQVVAIDVLAGTIEIEQEIRARERRPESLHLYDKVPLGPLPGALHELARWVAEHGLDAPSPEHRAARDLLLRRPPRLAGGAAGPLRRPGEPLLDAARRLARALDGGVLALQGPPGTGKTHDGARMIVDLARAGKRVGVSATSHKVIRNLLEAVLRAADGAGVELHATHKPGERADGLAPAHGRLHLARDRAAALAALDQGHVIGGVAWLWAAPEAAGRLDHLFLDEAGQMSLAMVLACARSARNLVLLGDPQQLQQPQRGAHPEGAEISALEHLLGEHETMPPELGLFLEETHRLPPAIASFTSELFYEDRLRSRPGRERQQLTGPTRFAGSGLFLVPAAHDGNTSSSPEEVLLLLAIARDLLQPGVAWTDHEGRSRALAPADILVIAPYNAQVAALTRAFRTADLPLDTGTVDRFQGQERAVVLYSLTSSSPADAPRGLPFLHDLHRLNVATSRARCACILVASPALFAPECRTPEEMRLANGLCRYRELARSVAFRAPISPTRST